MSDALQLRYGSFGSSGGTGNPPGFVGVALANTASVFGLAGVVMMRAGDTITHAGFAVTARTGTPPTYRISLQAVSTTDGTPSGTVLGGGSPASATFTPPADASWTDTYQWIALANSYTAVRGEILAVVVEYSSGTINASNCSSFARNLNGVDHGTQGFPYNMVAAAAGPSSWATALGRCVFAVKSSTAIYGFPCCLVTTTNFSSDSTPDEYALAFTIPALWFSSFSVLGVRAVLQTPAAGKTVLVSLYAGTTSLQSVTWDSDQEISNGAGGRVVELYFSDTTLATLTPGTVYRVGFAPQQTATNLNIPSLGSTAAGDLAGWPFGTTCYLSTRTNGGAWTDDTTKRPYLEVILDTVTGGTVGGPSAEVSTTFLG